jgi:serine/threonine-protein kinase
VDDRYEITEILGEGGMGRVYAAQDRALGREVALKIARDAAHDQRVEHEARTLAPLRNRNLLAVFGAGRHGERAYLVTERLVGTTLEQELDDLSHRDERMALGRIVDVLAAIAEGLAVLHRAGLSHLDLKPANVMLCDDRVVLIDFGLTRADMLAKTDGRAHGTAEYVAPEVVRGDLASDSGPLVDLYALGIVAFEMIVGHPPFTSDSIAATLHRHASEGVPYVRQLRPEVPVPLAELVAALVEKAPEARPCSADAVLQRLSDVRAHGLAARATRLLVIDDDPRAFDELRRRLETSMPQLRISSTRDSAVALERIDDLHPTVVALDLDVPDVNAVEICMAILALPVDRRPAVVAVSEAAAPRDLALLRRLGVRDFVRKDRCFVAAVCDRIAALCR